MMKVWMLLATLAISPKLLAQQTQGSCTYSGQSLCMDYVGEAWYEVQERIEMACENEGGHFSFSGCEAKDRIARCLYSPDTPFEYQVAYYEPMDIEDARSSCLLNDGQFVEGKK